MNRNIRYILIGVILLLWGIIFKRIFGQNNNIVAKTQTFIEEYKSTASSFKFPLDTNVLLLTYQNPFGMTTDNRIMAGESHEIYLEHPVRSGSNPEELLVTYLGLLYSESTQKYSVIVEKQGEKFIVREGKANNGLEFISLKNNKLKFRIDGVFKSVMISDK